MSHMVEAFLWVITETKIFRITLSKLIDLGEKEEVGLGDATLPSPPFDFGVDLPEKKMLSFVFDSKIYVGGGLLKDIVRYCDTSSYKIYELDTDNQKLIETDSIPRPPAPFDDSFIGNISGDVYLLVYKSDITEAEGLWVLRSGLEHKEWKPLPPPPPINNDGFRDSFECFVLQGKLFFQAFFKGRPVLYSFDTRTATWSNVDDDIMNSFALRGGREFFFPDITISLPGLSNCSVTLSWCYLKAPGDYQVKVMIHALLVNSQNGAVFLHQPLEECLEGIQPTSFYFPTSGVTLVNLGNGMVSALLYGHTLEHDGGHSPLLCISVFTLAVLEPGIDFEIEAPRKKQRFLSVRVHVKRVFTMKEYGDEELQDAFILPSKDELPH